VFKMASCDGCQLQLIDAEEALLDLAGAIEIANFAEASSNMQPGPYDVALVEGSISAPEQIEQLEKIREESGLLITIGACATSGGIQALRNGGDLDEAIRRVYPHPEFVKSLETSTPVADHVKVDLELTGCPIDRGELLNAISQLLQGSVPRLATTPVCIECKRRGYTCVLVTRDEPCLGPVTRTGCGAICPAFARGCYGCFGPSESPNTEALSGAFLAHGLSPAQARDRFRFITGSAPGFAKEAERLDKEAMAT
jgi:coenzyme F420-reducing hydrogenase gamma subunit